MFYISRQNSKILLELKIVKGVKSKNGSFQSKILRLSCLLEKLMLDRVYIQGKIINADSKYDSSLRLSLQLWIYKFKLDWKLIVCVQLFYDFFFWNSKFSFRKEEFCSLFTLSSLIRQTLGYWAIRLWTETYYVPRSIVTDL